jgi:hypothetical protein
MAIEIVDLPINSMVIFNSYVSLPEGNSARLGKRWSCRSRVPWKKFARGFPFPAFVIGKWIQKGTFWPQKIWSYRVIHGHMDIDPSLFWSKIEKSVPQISQVAWKNTHWWTWKATPVRCERTDHWFQAPTVDGQSILHQVALVTMKVL